MTIKEFAFSAQQHIQAQTGALFKRSHIYELLATAFDYNSFAALNSESILFPGSEIQSCTQDQHSLHNRCVELGYPEAVATVVASEFLSLIEQSRINCVPLIALISRLRQELSHRGYGDWQDEEEFYEDESLSHLIDENWPPFFDESDSDMIDHGLLISLEDAAAKENADAHYALALIHAPVDVDQRDPGADYWYNQEKNGRLLTGVEKEWADHYAYIMAKDKKYEHHLREAGKLENELALLDLAEHFDEPAFFEKARNSTDHNPLKVAEIAENLDRLHDAHDWLIIAAEAGEIEAMRRLIEEYDQDDLQRGWTWIYLSQLLGNDITKDDYYAINEDGSAYDDDVGGPLFVDGRGGIRLQGLSEEQDILARNEAQRLFEKIDQ